MSHPLYETCHTHFYGHKDKSAAETFAQMAEFCAKHNVDIDGYGEGEFIQAFEAKIADLLGYEKAVFFITGTMAQSTIMQIACNLRKNDIVAMHPTCHIFYHENQGYQIYDRFKVLPIGDPYSVWKKSDLEAYPDEISACIYELPMRVIGGQLPSWNELQQVKEHCHDKNIHCHMDGARLWECAAYYDKSYAEIAQGFDSAYVSLYKGIGGLGGAMLLGDAKMIEKASIAMQRQGGNVYARLPYIVSAAMNFDEKIAKMPSFFEHTKHIYKLMKKFPRIKLNPPTPQANMLHIHLPVSSQKAAKIRDEIAKEHGIWIYGGGENTELPNNCKREWYIGENFKKLPDEVFLQIMEQLSQKLAS